MPKNTIMHSDSENELGLSQDRPSRTSRKKAAEALQKTGEQLLSLSDTQLDTLDITPELRQAVVDARSMTRRGARRRQLQYIGSLMRSEEGHQLQQRLARMAKQSSADARRFKQVELWRDELKAGNEGRLTWLLEQFPELDPDALTQLVDAAKQSKAADARQAGRALFRYLRQLVDGKD